MSGSGADGPARIAVFDLDGTITRGDSLVAFLRFALRRRRRRLLGLWRLPAALVRFAIDHDRGPLKGTAIQGVLGGSPRTELIGLVEEFLDGQLAPLLRPGALEAISAHRSAGDHLVLLTASPDLYVEPLGRRLGFGAIHSTRLRWQGDVLDGRLDGLNVRGHEKRRFIEGLRSRSRGTFMIAYGNAESDLEHLTIVDEPHLVNADAKVRVQATRLGISCSDWP